MIQLINDKGVCRTDPARPGLLKIQGEKFNFKLKREAVNAILNIFSTFNKPTGITLLS